MRAAGVDILGTGTQSRYAIEILTLEASGDPFGPLYRRPRMRVLRKVVRTEDFDAGMVVPTCATIVCHGNPLVKERLHEALGELDVPIAMAAVHPAAVLSSSAHVGAGSIVNAGAYLGQCVELGWGVMVHAGVVVEHDSVVCNFANLAPGVTVCGGVTIGECVSVCAGATIGPGVIIGDRAKVYAGSVVLDNMPAGYIARGVPAKLLPPALSL